MKNESPIVRKATLLDMPTLKQFKLGLIKAEMPMDPTIKEDTTSYYDIEELIKEPDSEVLVVDLEGEIVASGYAQILTDKPYLKHEKQGYLGFMFVPPAHRGKGYNKLIVNGLLAWCKKRGVFEIKLDVYDQNPNAIRAYEKAGFEKYLINMRMNIEHLDV